MSYILRTILFSVNPIRSKLRTINHVQPFQFSRYVAVLVIPRGILCHHQYIRRLKPPLLRSHRSSLSSSSRSPTSKDEQTNGNNATTLPEKVVSAFPPSLQPFLKISRMHRPIGTWLLFWPCTWGLILGSEGIPTLSLLGLFGLGAFIMRGAGCTINDMWDRNIDSKVTRTRDRPLASGQLRLRHAAAWTGLQLSGALAILLQLNSPCFLLAIGSLGLVVLYPLAKRVTHWPQAVLGLTFNTGVLLGFAASQSPELGYLTLPWLNPACLALYFSGLSWTLIYDTIYAHQDKEEDSLLGLGSTAQKFGPYTKYWLTGFSTSMIGSLTLAGQLIDASWPFYAGITATAAHLTWQIITLDIQNHKNCADRFTSNRNIGWIICLGLLGSYWLNKHERVTEVVPKAELVA